MDSMPDYQDLDPVRLAPEWSDDEPGRARAVSKLLELRKAGGGGRVAGREDQLDALGLQVGADLECKAADLRERPGAEG